MIHSAPSAPLRFNRLIPAVVCAWALSACASVGYYVQSVQGQLDVLARRQPIDALLNDADTPEAMRAKLAYVQDARAFASGALGLPDNGSYRRYSDVERNYVVWNVVATPEFSLAPRQWCFAVVGCLSYRGYFRQDAAEDFAARLRERGDDVYTAGIAAYSTLGWFDDPVLNTMLSWPDTRIAGLIFHELAHQQIYVQGDTAFNEAFAVTVEVEGMRRWLEHRGCAPCLQAFREEKRREDAFARLVMSTRERLDTVYASTLDVDAKRAEKAAVFRGMREEYLELKNAWGGYAGYDRWFAHDLNNAQLALVATYREFVPAFQALLESQGGDLAAFYRAAAGLGALPREERADRLRALLAMPSTAGLSPAQ